MAIFCLNSKAKHLPPQTLAGANKLGTVISAHLVC